MSPAERERLGREGAAMSLDEAVADALGTDAVDLGTRAAEPLG